MKNIAKVLILVALASTALHCGKKVEDQGPQFDIKSLDVTDDGSAANTVITRSDENSGPTYKISGDLSNTQYIDKKLICGDATFPSRRALKVDAAFSTFKISEAEFHGLNLLPLFPTCALEITATNSVGSTVTKKLSVHLKFDRVPLLTFNTRIANSPQKNMDRVGSELKMERYDITNNFPYTVSLFYKNTFVLHIEGNATMDLSVSRVEFTPAINDPLATPSEGYWFKLKPGESVTITAFGAIPNYMITPMTICVTGFAGPQFSLFMAEDMEPTRKDLKLGPTRLTQ